MNELERILQIFAASDYELIQVPARRWLDGEKNAEALKRACLRAQEECGGCGCALDPLYEKALSLL